MPGLSMIPTDATVLPKLAATERTNRLLKLTQWWNYYDGDQKKFLKVRDGDPDCNTIVNLTARVVDQSVNFMVGTVPTFDLPGENKTQSETMLDAWLKVNDFEDFVNDLFVMAAVTGHAYVKLVKEENNVRPIVLDTGLVTAYWNPMDKSKPMAYMIMWTDSENNQVREDHVNLGASWEIRSYTGKGNEWTATGTQPWSYPFAQIIEWKNLPNPRGYYGKSDVEAVVNLNDAYNFRLSNTNKILYIHAHPRTIAFGVEKDQLQKTAIDGLWTIADKEARVENLEMESDLESSRANANDIKSDFFSDAQTVDLATVKDKAGALTNFGLKLLFTEALGKNAKKRRLAGRGLANLITCVGTLMGQMWNGVKVVWADPLPENKVEQVTNAKEEIAMKVSSRQTQSERLGYDWQRELKQMADEKQADTMDLGTMLMNNLRDANSGSGE